MLLRTLAILLCLILNAAAQSPYPLLYAGIGDGLYKSTQGYKALMKLESFKSEHDALRAYVDKAGRLKQKGFSLDKEGHPQQSRVYITALRELAKEKKALDHAVLNKIRLLKKKKAYAQLKALAKNPDPMIAGAAYVKGASMPRPVKKQKSTTQAKDDLGHSLIELKGRLLMARSEDRPEVQCLNDVTAINYWMVEVEKLKNEREWCRAYDACGQVINFERSAARSCTPKNPLYAKWRELSVKYRIEYRKEYAKRCP